MVSSKTILVTAGAGNIGRELIPQLLQVERKPKLILPTSSASKLKSKLAAKAVLDGNVIVEEGSIKDPNWFQGLLEKHQVDSVFLCLTGTDELFDTMNIFNSMRHVASVKKLVYLSACGDFSSPAGIKYVMSTQDAAHVVVKSVVELKLMYGNFPFDYSIVGPTLFFSNDLRALGHMKSEGLFSEPLGEAGVSRVSPADIGLVIKNLIYDDSGKYSGRKVMVGSRRAYKGKEICDLWGDVLGRQIRMVSTDDAGLAQMEKHIGTYAGPAWGRDLRLMYEGFRGIGFGMTNEDYALQVEVLGKEADDYETWVRKVGGHRDHD